MHDRICNAFFCSYPCRCAVTWLVNASAVTLALGGGAMSCAGDDSRGSGSVGGGGAAPSVTENTRDDPAGGGGQMESGNDAPGGNDGSGTSPTPEGGDGVSDLSLAGGDGEEGAAGGGAAGARAADAGVGAADAADAVDDGTEVGGGDVSFDPPEAISSVTLSVTTAGVVTALRLDNSFGSPVTLTDLSVSGNDAPSFVVDGAPALPVVIAAGDALDVTIRFLPPGNAPTGAFAASLSASVSGEEAGDLAVTAGLFGLATRDANSEATLAQVLATLGHAIDVGSTSSALGTGSNPVGEEVLVDRFVRADAALPVRLEPVARYSPMEAADYGYYTGPAPEVTLTQLGTMSQGPQDNVANRTLFPPLEDGAQLELDPGTEPFGLYAESQVNVPSLGPDGRFFQEDALNDDQAGVQPVHRFRVFPLRSRGGERVDNAYLVVCEEASNSDYQDYVFLLSNVTPAT